MQSPLLLLGLEKSYDIIIKVFGGGLSGQSEAILRFLIYAFLF
jgi:ribosomal protein S9